MKAIMMIVTALLFIVLARMAGAQELAVIVPSNTVSVPYEMRSGKGAIHGARDLTTNEQRWRELIWIHSSGKIFHGDSAQSLWKGRYMVYIPTDLVQEKYRPIEVVKITEVPVDKSPVKPSGSTKTGGDPVPLFAIINTAVSLLLFSIVLIVFLQVRKLTQRLDNFINNPPPSHPYFRKQIVELSELVEELKHFRDALHKPISIRAREAGLVAVDKLSHKEKTAAEICKDFIELLLEDWGGLRPRYLETFRQRGDDVISYGVEGRACAEKFAALLKNQKHRFINHHQGCSYEVTVTPPSAGLIDTVRITLSTSGQERFKIAATA